MVDFAMAEKAASGSLRNGIEICSSLAGMMHIEAAWRDLECRSSETFAFFQSYDWCHAWASQFVDGAKPIADIRIFTIWRDGRLALLWPGMLTRGPLGARVLRALGEPHTQYCTVLHDPACADAEVHAAFLTALSREGGADLAVFDLVPDTSLLAGMLSRGARNPTLNETAVFRLDVFPSWDDYLRSLGSKQRSNRKRRRDRLAGLGELGFRVVWPGQSDYARLLHTCIEWKRRWLAETGRISQGFSIEGYEAFLSRLPGDPGSRSGACLFALEVSGRPVAIEFGFIVCGQYYAYIGGFDWECREYSPGKVAMEHCLRWLIEEKAITYDLLGNPADYKSSWSNMTVPLHRFSRTMSLRGQIYGTAWLDVTRPALKQLYRAVPERVRRAVLLKARAS
jgi:CelD/BcsL family acetyltransferase involved in cellulose biosynthesis